MRLWQRKRRHAEEVVAGLPPRTLEEISALIVPGASWETTSKKFMADDLRRWQRAQRGAPDPVVAEEQQGSVPLGQGFTVERTQHGWSVVHTDGVFAAIVCSFEDEAEARRVAADYNEIEAREPRRLAG
jgi:hypothetical protein